MADESQVLLHERRDHVGIITFNRPRQRNALSPQLLRELCDVLADWATSGDIRVVIFTGAGDKAFSAGYDISAIETVGMGPDAPLENASTKRAKSMNRRVEIYILPAA